MSSARPQPTLALAPSATGESATESATRPVAGRRRCRQLTLLCAPVVVPQVRGLLGDLLLAWGLPARHELAYDLRLIATELIANAVEHAAAAGPALTITLELADSTVSFGVSDGDPHFPEPGQGDDDTSGRGRLIVRTLAAEAGGTTEVERRSDGKTLWVRLPWPGE